MLRGERGVGSCQGEGEDVGDEVKGQGSPCPADEPGVGQGTHSPCCRGCADRSAPARPWSSAERGKRAGRVAGWPYLWAAQRGHGATDLPVEQTLRGKQRPHPAVTSWARPALSSPLCQGPGDKPWLAQGNTQGSKFCLPGNTSAPCPGLQVRPAAQAASPGDTGMAVPCACPTLQEEHSALALPGSCQVSIPSRIPCTSAAQTLAQLFCRIKSTWESASPALATASLENRAVCPVVPSQPLTALAVPWAGNSRCSRCSLNQENQRWAWAAG